jgi:ankyrin repeat protein
MADACWHEQDDEDEEEGVKFIEAAKMGNADELRRLICSDELPYINHIVYMDSYYGEPALHVAIRENYAECVDVLLGCPQLDISTLSDYTALDGVNALTLCVILDRPVAFQKLISVGASVNGLDAIDTPTVVWAASQNRIDYMGELLCHGADVNATTRDGETPLYFAKLHNYIEMQEFLLKMGGIDPFDDDGSQIRISNGTRPMNDDERKRLRIDTLAKCRHADKIRIHENQASGSKIGLE